MQRVKRKKGNCADDFGKMYSLFGNLAAGHFEIGLILVHAYASSSLMIFLDAPESSLRKGLVLEVLIVFDMREATKVCVGCGKDFFE